MPAGGRPPSCRTPTGDEQRRLAASSSPLVPLPLSFTGKGPWEPVAAGRDAASAAAFITAVPLCAARATDPHPQVAPSDATGTTATVATCSW